MDYRVSKSEGCRGRGQVSSTYYRRRYGPDVDHQRKRRGFEITIEVKMKGYQNKYPLDIVRKRFYPKTDNRSFDTFINLEGGGLDREFRRKTRSTSLLVRTQQEYLRLLETLRHGTNVNRRVPPSPRSTDVSSLRPKSYGRRRRTISTSNKLKRHLSPILMLGNISECCVKFTLLGTLDESNRKQIVNCFHHNNPTTTTTYRGFKFSKETSFSVRFTSPSVYIELRNPPTPSSK